MPATTPRPPSSEQVAAFDRTAWSRSIGIPGRNPRNPHTPNEDIELWLKHNAPLTFQQLADIRYSLYHHCSRADFTVANISDDQFDLTGRHGTLRIVSDNARRYYCGSCDCWAVRRIGLALSPEQETRDEGKRSEVTV
jgi:hypothetical protein